MSLVRKVSVIFLIIIALLCMSAAYAATVVVVNETEESFYTVNNIDVTGDLEQNYIQISGDGDVISDKAKVYLFGLPSEMNIENLKVNGNKGILSFDDKAYYFIAEKGPVDFSADVTFKTLGQIRLNVPGPVNKIAFNLRNGYPVGGDAYGVYNQVITLQKTEKVITNVDGSYKYSYADENSFTYMFSFQAFGTTLSTYTIPLYNNEQVYSVSGALKWEVIGDNLVLELENDRASVQVYGYFNSNTIRVPLETDGNVVIESDPEKKLTIDTDAKEVDISEAGIYPSYTNARAFIASSKNTIRISVKQLDLMPSLSASVSQATQRFAMTPEGSILGEMTYRYDNTGVEYISLDGEGTPLYAGTGYYGGAVKLTKDPAREDKLFLTFPKQMGGQLDYIFFTTRNKILPVDMIKVPLVKTDLPITTMTSTFYLPGDLFVLNVFGAKGGSELPDLKSMIIFAAIVGLIGYFFLRNKAFVAYYIAAAVGLYYFSVALFFIALGLSIVLIIKRHIDKSHVKWILIAAGIIIVLVLVVGAGLSFTRSMFGSMSQKSMNALEIADYADVERSNAPSMSMEKVGSGSGAIAVPTKKGVLPVKFQLPTLGKTITVRNDLITAEKQPSLSIWVISSYFVYLIYLGSLFAIFMCWKIYTSEKTETESKDKKK